MLDAVERCGVRPWMRRRMRAAWRWVVAPLPSEWVRAGNVVVPQGESKRPGPVDFRDTPWWYEILDWAMDHRVKRISVEAVAQIGKSFWLQSAAAWHFAHRRSQILSLIPNETEAKTWLEERLIPLLKASPGTRGLLVGLQGEKTTTIHGSVCPAIIVRWFQSRTAAKSKSAGLMQIDELDEAHKDGAQQLKKLGDLSMRMLTRARAQPWGLLQECSTPTDEDKGIHAAVSGAQQWRPMWACPDCGEVQPWEFFRAKGADRGGVCGIKDEAGQFLSPDEIKRRRSAYYECRSCGRRIDDAEKRRLNASARLVCTTPERYDEHRGVPALNAMYSPDVTFSDLAAAFVSALGDPYKMVQFRQEWLALPRSSSRVQTPRQEQIAAYRDPSYKQGAYPGAEAAPAWVRWVVYGADVQRDHYWVVCRGIGYDGETGVLWAGRLEAMDHLAALTNLVWDTQDGRSIKPLGGFIDSGDRTQEVYQFCARNPLWLPIKGWRSRPDPLAASSVDRRREGFGWVDGTITLYHCSNVYMADLLMGYYERDIGTGAGCCHLPADIPPEYLQHLTNEVRKQRTGAGGTEAWWEPVHEGADNHLFDADKYAIAFAHHRSILARRAPTTPTVVVEGGEVPTTRPGTRDFTRRAVIPTRPFTR